MFKLTDKQKIALRAMRSGKNCFITGQAGTGKSAILKEFTRGADSNLVAITSTTGISAVAIDGRTLHSWAGIMLGEETAYYLYKKIRSKRDTRERWLNVRTLIIDEVSMLSSELFDKLEKIARLIRRDERPFGGIHLILTGDFCQLPIIKSDFFCFESKSWSKCIDITIYLEKVMRQDDPTFCNLLQEVRLGVCTQQSIDLIEDRVRPAPDAIHGIEPTRLFSKNSTVNRINTRRLRALIKGGAEELKYKTKFDISKNVLREYQLDTMKTFLRGTYNDVTVAIGAQVMLTWNVDTSVGLANGSLGIITGLVNGMPKVKFLNGVETVIGRVSVPYEIDQLKIMISFLPLRLAWSYTIHKSQGATLDFVVTNLGEDSIFEYGQAYVALSRVRSLNCLYLEDFDEGIFRCHPRVKKYYAKLKKSETNTTK